MQLIRPVLATALIVPLLAAPAAQAREPADPRPVPAEITSTPLAGVDTGALRSAGAADGVSPDTTPAALSGQIDVPEFDLVAVTWEATSPVPATDISVTVRVREAGSWSDWTDLGVPELVPDPEVAARPDVRAGTDPLFTSGADAVQVRVDTTTGAVPAGLEVATIDAGESPADADPGASGASYGPAGATGAPAPAIITRAQWGADESVRTELLGQNNTVKSAVMHHTAGSNSYTMEGAAAQVRGIYAYHGITLGWGDIGYHFLVDKFGRIYEGRYGSLTGTPKGAHAAGNNTDTMGVSAMGNYEVVAPPQVMVDAMAMVTGWKLAEFGVDPSGTVTQLVGGTTGSRYPTRRLLTLPVINAHMDTYYTLCPGQYLYPKMGEIRAKATAAALTWDSGPVGRAQLFPTYQGTLLDPQTRSYAVRDLELELTRRGHDVGHVDITWEDSTGRALRAFQGPAMLPLDDTVDDQDWRALSGLSYTKVVIPTGQAVFDAHGTTYIRAGYVSEAVRTLQHNLNRAGYPAGAADGHWDGAVTTAVRDWQSDAQLEVDAAMHTNDWRALAGLPYTRVNSALRLSGSNRYGTAAAVSAASFDPGVEVAYVATGTAFPDALSGAARAATDGAPVLLTLLGSIPGPVAAELGRLQPQRIVVLGDTGVVSEAVEAQLRTYATADTADEVTRLAGANRYATSAQVAATYPAGLDVVYVATGTEFPDALSGAALAGRDGAPVLLTRPDRLSDEVRAELARIGPQRIVILGGETAISADVEEELRSYATGDTADEVTRLAGANRYATSAQIAAGYAPGTPVYVASGAGFPDALAGAAVAGRDGAPVLLTLPESVPASVAGELARLAPGAAFVLGGRASVSTNVAVAVSGYLR